MTSVLISIRPKWCEKIASGKKTIEVRKTRPNLPTPFKCYIYCTNSELLTRSHYDGRIYVSTSKKYKKALEKSGNKTLSGTVIGEFVCKNIDTICPDSFIVREDAERALDGSCLTISEAKDYAGWRGKKIWECKDIYGWHITDLKIYDTPMPLQRLYGYCGLFPQCETCGDKCPIRCRPPQSWCYVDDKEEER